MTRTKTFVIMDTYEEKYKEALERAKTLYENANGMILKKWVEQVFPELTESEDEWIRKALIEYFTTSDDNSYYAVCGVDTKKILDWLEKQASKTKKVSIWKHWKDGIAGCAEGEQIFLVKIGRIYSISSCLGCECDYIELSELDKLMREEKQAPKPKWSEEDDAYKLFAISAVEDYYDETNLLQKELVNWLKTLKDRVQPQSQPAWSEDDEHRLKNSILFP